ncbi:MAG: NAD(P)/FAD-dependent oxidoreductase [Candidatus Aenigmarchaeota archaeon]|nr:NAD(P)/FAD-dependent oxidoreductase [Candidatus Aenigmarchaeota archaeon]
MTQNKYNDSHYDIIVIGAGISGLLSALALSKEGKKVLILEKDSKVGGVCRSYEVDDYRVDTGPHAITRLDSGPLRELMDKYFDVVPQFVPFGKYYVRASNRLEPFPWSLKDWLTFDIIPKKDRLLLMKSLFDMFYRLSMGKDLSAVSIADVLPSEISSTTRRFWDYLSYFMLGTSMKSAPVSRFIDNKCHKQDDKPSSIPYAGKIYNLLISEGATDHKYPKGGIQSITNCILSSFPKNRVEIKTNEQVTDLQTSDTNEITIKGVSTEENNYSCDIVVYSGFASDLPNLISGLPEDYARNLMQIKKVNSLTIWLGLTKQFFSNHGCEMWVDSDPYIWAVPTSNYDPGLAPAGKQLVGFATVLPEKYDPAEARKKALNAIIQTIPEIESHIDMIHYQELIPEKAAWSLDSSFGDVKTPIKNLYTVGTDAEKRSMGITRAAYSVLRCLRIMRSERVL